jgi:hypothetical protein
MAGTNALAYFGPTKRRFMTLPLCRRIRRAQIREHARRSMPFRMLELEIESRSFKDLGVCTIGPLRYPGKPFQPSLM